MCVHIIRNVIFFYLEYLQDIQSTEPIPGQGPLKPTNPGLSQKKMEEWVLEVLL
jgi:hypothetical protein